MNSIPRERKKDGGLETLTEKNARGEYELVEPLDYLILAQLQDEGTLMGGYYPLATSASSLVKHFKKELPNTLITARLRVMHIQKLVVSVTTQSRSKGGWQRTKKGKELVEAWQQRQAK